MSRLVFSIVVAVALGIGPAFGDDALYRYEGDVLPYDESAGWIIADECDHQCSESLEDGHFVLRWSYAANLANYHYTIAEAPSALPLPLWVEWRFRSNHPIGPYFCTCDGRFSIHVGGMHEVVYMYGDAAMSRSTW